MDNQGKGMKDRDVELMGDDLCRLLIDNETRELGSTDSPRSYTREEIRDLLEALYDRQYDPEDRDCVSQPTQIEVDQCLDAMLGSDDLIIETDADGRIFMAQDDIQVQWMMGKVRDALKAGGDG